VILERNERFFGQRPALRRIEYALYLLADKAWAAFVAEQGDASVVPLYDAKGPSSASLKQALALKGVMAQQTATLFTAFLSVGQQNAPFDDLRVREAFALSIDREAIAHDIYKDTVQPSAHLLPEGLPGYNPDLADASGRKGKDALGPDIVMAQRLASAYAAEKCGGNYALCPAVTYFVGRAGINSPTTRGKLMSLLLDQWRRAFPGWKILLDDGCHLQVCEIKPVQVANFGWQADYPDPQDFFSNLWTTHAYYNQSFVSIAQVDALCAQAGATNDQSTRMSQYQQAEQLLIDQVGAVPLYQTLDANAVRARVANWHLAPTGVTPLSVWQATYLRR
jgi:oligopeptide transport system substrate-binding protein